MVKSISTLSQWLEFLYILFSTLLVRVYDFGYDQLEL